jgi:DNA-binding Lrp family transcriptional regulator
MTEPSTLDHFDRRILHHLQRDGRLTNQEIGARVHLSPSQCSRRRSRLERAGVIRGYRAELDRGAVGFDLTVFVSVTLATHNPDNAKRFASLIGDLDAVQEAHAMTGEMDYLLKVVVRDLAELAAFVNEVLLPHESVLHVKSTICLSTIKDQPVLPLL